MREIKIRFSPHFADRERVASRHVEFLTRRAYSPLYDQHRDNMDSDEEMQQMDSEPPFFPSVSKGKGKAVLQDELEDLAARRDDTLPWYMKFLSRSR